MKKLVLLFLFTSLSCYDIKISSPGSVVGETFKVCITVKSDKQEEFNLNVPGLDQFEVLHKQTSRSLFVINGKFSSKTMFTYDLQAKSEGEFSFGPAYIQDGEKKIESNDVKFTVEKNAEPKSEVYLKLVSNKQKVILGESVMLTAKFYMPESFRGNISSLSLPDTPGFVLKEKGSLEKSEIIENQNFNVVEKNFLLTPIKTGEKQISPIKAVYAYPVDGDEMLGFFGQRYAKKIITSNALKLDVEDVPIGDVNGIGSFDNFNLELATSDVNVNEPVTLKATIYGKGNFDQVKTPKFKLKNIFKCYQSKSSSKYQEDQGELVGKKVFEYVLQAVKPGDLEIPSQKFVYYDTASKSVKTLMSEPIHLKVNGDELVEQPQEVAAIFKSKKKKDISEIQEDGPLFYSKDNGFNLWVFSLLILLPLILFGSNVFLVAFQFLAKRFKLIFWPREPLGEARKRLKVLVADDNVKNLYQFILGFLSEQFNVSDSVVGEDWIREQFLELGWKFEEVEDFLEFFHRIAGLSFSSGEDKIDKDKLFADMEQWINRIGSKKG